MLSPTSRAPATSVLAVRVPVVPVRKAPLESPASALIPGDAEAMSTVRPVTCAPGVRAVMSVPLTAQ